MDSFRYQNNTTNTNDANANNDISHNNNDINQSNLTDSIRHNEINKNGLLNSQGKKRSRCYC